MKFFITEIYQAILLNMINLIQNPIPIPKAFINIGLAPFVTSEFLMFIMGKKGVFHI